jgi:hypothetical protein
MLTLSALLKIGGVLHFGILFASALVPQVLDWRKSLAPLDKLLRQLIWVHGIFIVLVIIGFGILSLLNSDALASGTFLARSVCGFIALFWLARLGIQFFVFDPTGVINGPWLRAGYHGLTAVFTYMAVVYGLAALLPARLLI